MLNTTHLGWNRSSAALQRDADALLSSARRQGFVPSRQLTGGKVGIAVAGEFKGRPAVLKLSPDDGMTEELAAAFTHWGPALAPEVLQVAGRALLVGFIAGGAIPDENTQLEILRRLHERAPSLEATSITPVLTRMRRWNEVAATRAQHRGRCTVEELDDVSQTIMSVGASHSAVLAVDTHPGNWVAGTSGDRLVDADPVIGPPALDFARWVIAAGPTSVAMRSKMVLNKIGRSLDVALWLNYTARERAIAMNFHGATEAWAEELVVAADRAAAVHAH